MSDVPSRVGCGLQLTATADARIVRRVVRERGDIAHVRARAIHREPATEAIVGVGPCSNCSASGHRLGQQVPVAVVGHLRYAIDSRHTRGLRYLCRQAEGRMPLRGRRSRYRGGISGAGQPFGSRRLEIARQVENVGRFVSVEIDTRADIAVHIVGCRRRDIPRNHRWLTHRSHFENASGISEGIDPMRAQRIGHRRRTSTVSKTEQISATRVLSGDASTRRIIGKRRKAPRLLVYHARKKVGVGRVLVDIRANAIPRIGH